MKDKAAIDESIQLTGHVVAVLTNVHTGKKRIYETKNVVTDKGDLFYAQRGALLTGPTDPLPEDFVDGSGLPDMIMELYNGASLAPAKTNQRDDMVGIVGVGKVMDATYPRTADPDGDNSGSGDDIVTYHVEFTTAEVNGAAIDDVILTNPSPIAADELLMHAEFAAPFTKTSSDTLKVFVNHRMNGVP